MTLKDPHQCRESMGILKKSEIGILFAVYGAYSISYTLKAAGSNARRFVFLGKIYHLGWEYFPVSEDTGTFDGWG